MADNLTLQRGPDLAPPARQALLVLDEFLTHQTGRQPRRQATLKGSHAIVIGEGSEQAAAGALRQVRDDGYALAPSGSGLLLVARNPKGLLNAAYGYLAHCGVLWPAPDEEILPRPGKLVFPTELVLRNPAFPRRGIFHSQPPAEFARWCEWYARLGFNEMSAHGGAEGWAGFCKVAERFGMTLEHGGHGLSSFVPRELFGEHPDYFRTLQPPDFDRTRLSDSNICTGSPGAMKLVKANAKRWVRQLPGARVYHLWADDLPAGGWCYCSRCMGLTPQDQAVLANNQLAEGVCEADPDAKVAAIWYHDTLETPLLVKPHEALEPLFAPRERCYGHALDDPTCARNAWHRQRLEKTLDYFGRRDWNLFEYYSDYILFRAMLPVMPEIVAQDLRYYKSQGLMAAQHLLVGTVVGLLLNLHVFAQQTWDLDADPWEPLRKLAAGTPGLLKAWKLQAKASARWLPICDWPIERYFDYRFLIEVPPAAAAKYAKQTLRAAEELEQAEALLPADLPAWAERERLAFATSAGICRQMSAQITMLGELGRCSAGEKRGAEAKAAYREALRAAGPVGKAFQKADMPEAYFFGLEKLLETIWKEKVTGAACK
ncbi:MAG TPA: DUF4838 domain-containing protein [Armatimonadota bacterium]|jgi:hypothetical protein